jgi:hypothetical protein
MSERKGTKRSVARMVDDRVLHLVQSQLVTFINEGDEVLVSLLVAFFVSRLQPRTTQTRGRGIPLYRPAGLWHPVGDPSHVLWDFAAPSDDPGELRNIQKTRFGGGSRGSRGAYRRVSASFWPYPHVCRAEHCISAPSIGTFGSGASFL